ncbi:hypothetical protein EG329_002518 [Mollisiaceae sp. DMI_Dod_QoI]|nr:hypothetical protein EG329_002518 [Helotiales sp. DMI_Dod_QoI]
MVEGQGPVATSLEKDDNPSFSKIFGTEIIRLLVGPEKKLYRVHKQRLCAKIPSFLIKIEDSTPPEGSVEDAKEIIVDLLDECVASWDILMRWVYHDTLPSLKPDTSRSGWNWDPFALYVLADQLEITKLQDTIMDMLQAGQARTKMWHSFRLLDWTWASTSQGCGMRRYFALSLVRSILVYKDPRDADPKKVFTFESKEIAEVLGKYPDLLEGVLDAMRGRDGAKARDPRMVDPREFHEDYPRRPWEYSGEGIGAEQEKQESEGSDGDKKPRKGGKKGGVRFRQALSIIATRTETSTE